VREIDEDGIADRVPVAIVDLLEAVEVEDEDGERVGVALADALAQARELLAGSQQQAAAARELGVVLLERGELDAAAQAHSSDMVQHNYLDHTGSDGSQPQERADRAGYHVPPNSGWIVVEVISAISAEPRGPVDWWLGDDQHRKVLMNPRWREIGAGYAQGGEYGNYWTALFGCRPGVLPTITVDGVDYTHTEQCGDPTVAAAAAPTPTPPVLPTPTPFAPPASARQPTAILGEQVTRPAATAAISAERHENTLTLSWTGIDEPNATDWFGVYRVGDTDTEYQDWDYLSCTRVADQARASGSCSISLPREPGPFQVRLFRGNGYTLLARSDQFPGGSTGAAQITLKVTPSTAPRGAVVNVEWRGIDAPTSTDWLGLYRAGDTDTQQVAWLYTGCAQVPLDARQFGSCNLLLPTTLASGTYEVRLFSANGYRRLAVSGTIVVD
jgi:hypothetical protein